MVPILFDFSPSHEISGRFFAGNAHSNNSLQGATPQGHGSSKRGALAGIYASLIAMRGLLTAVLPPRSSLRRSPALAGRSAPHCSHRSRGWSVPRRTKKGSLPHAASLCRGLAGRASWRRSRPSRRARQVERALSVLVSRIRARPRRHPPGAAEFPNNSTSEVLAQRAPWWGQAASEASLTLWDFSMVLSFGCFNKNCRKCDHHSLF